MVRHLTRQHDELRYSHSSGVTTNQYLKFKVQKSVQPSPSPVFDWTLSHTPDMFTNEKKEPVWLVALRRMAEFNRLLRDISLTSASQAFIEPYKVFFNRPRISEPFKIENLEVLGYMAYICKECLISYPQTLYWDGTNMAPVPTVHTCDNERLLEVKQSALNKDEVIETLYDRLPNLMFHAVKKWTKDSPLLMTAEIPPGLEGLQDSISVDKRGWAIRAIRNGQTTLSDDELVDFLKVAGLRTYARFRMGGLTKNYQMFIATMAAA
jgi:hypothetical protein